MSVLEKATISSMHRTAAVTLLTRWSQLVFSKASMKSKKYWILGCLLFFDTTVHAEKITIAAASDLRFALNEIAATFENDNLKDEVHIIYGSSGKFYAQIQQHAPYDFFFSADIRLPTELSKRGFAGSKVRPYAVGRLALWSASMDATKMTLASLTDPKIVRIAIANPKHAPYGTAAQQALRALGAWSAIKSKLVYGENISHAAQFVESGGAEIGIIALSLAVSPALAGRGGYWLVPDHLHDPLEQGFIITKRAERSDLARRFAAYLSSEAAIKVMRRYGFTLPETETETENETETGTIR